MGTRADFYVGQGLEAQWLGSIAWDGYQEGRPKLIINATSEGEYRVLVEQLLACYDDATRPEQGWPWPWEDSRLTDYAYAWTPKGVMVSCFGSKWWKATRPEPKDTSKKIAVFPNMEAIQKVTLGERSGVIIVGIPHMKGPMMPG